MIHAHNPELTRIQDLTRRELLSSAFAAALIIACGEDGEEAADANATREFVDSTGAAVQVPVRQQRIVAVHDYNAGVQVLALGGPLVGLSTRGGRFVEDVIRYFDVSGVAPVGEFSRPNVEQVAALAPDLIVCPVVRGAIAADGLDALRAIAPVVGINVFRPVAEVMGDYSNLLGEAATTAIDDLRAEYQSVIQQIRGLLGDRWRQVTASHVQINAVNRLLSAWGPTARSVNEILNELSVTWAPIQMEADSQGGTISGISLERMHEFSADIISVDLSFVPETMNDPLFQQLPAVQAKQVIGLRDLPSGTHYRNYTYLARVMLAQLQQCNPSGQTSSNVANDGISEEREASL